MSKIINTDEKNAGLCITSDNSYSISVSNRGLRIIPLKSKVYIHSVFKRIDNNEQLIL